LKNDNNHWESSRALGDILLQKGKYERCLKYYQHALCYQEENIELMYAFALATYRNFLILREQYEAADSESEDEIR
jgi:tetratricopeptide (TPR) repeat protein